MGGTVREDGEIYYVVRPATKHGHALSEIISRYGYASHATIVWYQRYLVLSSYRSY